MFDRAGPVVIVAEAGVNHNGDIELARRLVDAASAAGADYVKFQTFKARHCISKHALKAEYQTRVTDAQESQLEMVQKLELDLAAHETLLAHCTQSKIKFLSTAFDFGSIDLLCQLGIDFFKIASGEITNLPLLRKMGRTGKPIVLSTGMATLADVESALEVLQQAGANRERILLLQCNTEYPTPMEDVNLRAMLTMGEAFKLPVGYSDHTEGICVPIAAVALGARLIEKHLTLDRNLPGPDHQASLEPADFQSMVQSIRNVEKALGTGIKAPSPSEAKNREVARRSIVAASSIRPGELFSESNLTIKRPGTGLTPMLWDSMIGRKSGKSYQEDEMICEGN